MRRPISTPEQDREYAEIERRVDNFLGGLHQERLAYTAKWVIGLYLGIKMIFLGLPKIMTALDPASI